MDICGVDEYKMYPELIFIHNSIFFVYFLRDIKVTEKFHGVLLIKVIQHAISFLLYTRFNTIILQL